MSRFVTYPKPGANSTIRRFEPAYWTIDFPIAMIATLVTTDANSMRLKALFRTNRDLMGIIWAVEDRSDHGAYAYPRRKDYRGCVFEFDWSSSGIRPMDKLQSVTLTVETVTQGTHYIRIWNYKTNGTPDDCHIRLVLDQTTKSGFFGDSDVPWEDVKRMFISLQPITAGRGDCFLAAPAAQGSTSVTLNVGDGGEITPGATILILGSSFEVPVYTVTSTSSGPVQTVRITPAIKTAGGFAIEKGAEAFVQTATDEPIGESPAQVEISNMSITGPNSSLPMLTKPQAAHRLRMTDGYDNAYPFTPERLVEQVHALGYRDIYILYMGISKFHSLSWDSDEDRYVVDTAKPILNGPTQQWLEDFFARLHAKGYKIVISVSFEILARFMPTDWKQRDANGNEAQTGWQPPSSLVAPTNLDSRVYIRDIFLNTIALLPKAAEKHIQIGEPWWWDGSYGSNAPHIYDATTEAAYIAATGQAVPLPKLVSVFGEPADHQLPYLQWCRDQLGDVTAWVVAQVKSAHADVTTYLLIFTPQILRSDAPMLRTLNFPEKDWAAPAFDVLQIEDYDKVVEGDFAFTELTWQLAGDVLKYPRDQIHYFAGFNLLPETTWIWFNTDQAIWSAFLEGPAEVCIWSREQIMRDGWLFDEQSWKVYPDLTHLAQCWRIDRTDGVTQGFTSFDQELLIDGIVYKPANSFNASQLASDTEMSVADVELLGAVDSDDISASDLLAGVYDHAEVELFLVDWSNLNLPRTIVRRGWVGNVTQSGSQFKAELRGLAQRIQQPVIDSYSAECRVDLYDSKCGVKRAAFAIDATVTSLTDGSLGVASDNRVFYTSITPFPDGYFDYGEILWTSGANVGRTAEIRAYLASGRLELWEPLGLEIAIGDGFTAFPGCDKSITTCQCKFKNILNFRGEPYLPGNDALMAYPDAKA